MTTKTTSTTNDAGGAPAPPRLPKGREEVRIVTCNGCIHLSEADDGVGWCEFHYQYRSTRTPRECEGAQYFEEGN